MVTISVHLVLELVRVESAGEAVGLPHNKYRFSDLTGLRRHNERLHSLVPREMIFRDLHQEINDFFSLLNFKLNLGFREEAGAMCASMPPGSEPARYAGRLLLTAGHPQEAIKLLAPAK